MGRRKEFSADWDSFIRKTQGLARSQRSAMMDEVRLSSRLLLIVGVEAEIRNRNTRINNMQRLAAEQRRIDEKRRFTPTPGAHRNYVSASTKAMMPPIALHPHTPELRKASLNSSSYYFRTINPSNSSFSIRLGNRAVTEGRTYFQQWRVVHPFGGPVTADKITHLQQTIRSLRPSAARRRRTIEPAGISGTRALEIAIQSLNRK